MFLIMFCVAFPIYIYAFYYINTDSSRIRFFGYFILFKCFMLLLVTANNFLQLFIGWEGIGLLSYLLINFWDNRAHANKAALQALILNRIGDFCLLISIIFIIKVFQSTTFAQLSFIYYYVSTFKVILWVGYINIFLLVASCSKSAQIGFHI